MSKSKWTLSAVFGLSIMTLAACAGGEQAPLEITSQQVAALSLPEPGARPSEYHSRDVNFRLFGTQGAGSESASATLADTATWATETYAVGAVLGRNLQVAAVREGEVELLDTTTQLRRIVRAGDELRVSLIEHELDRVALDHGNHQWSVKAQGMAKVAQRYGVGATATAIEYAGLPGIKLSAVRRNSVLSRLGLVEGDLLLSYNGQAMTVSALTALATEVAQQHSQVVQLTIVRGGSFMETSYVIE
jgi:hypothetical protein